MPGLRPSAVAEGGLALSFSLRYRAECSSAQAVHNRVVEAIKAGTPLAHDLRLEGQELVVDEGTISAALPELPAVTRRPPPDNAGAPGSVLSTAQIAALAAGLREAAPSGYMLLTDAVRMLQRIGSRDGGTGLPQGWREATFTQLANALRLFDPHSTGYVAWHDLLGSLVAFAFPSIARATPSALAGAAAALSAAADRNGRVTKAQLLQTRLWYDTDGMSMAEREEELSKDQPYARSAELKGILFDALADVVPEGEEPKANWKPLLLYLCMDHDLLKGLQKAFAVLGSAGHIGQAETVTLGGRAVAQVAYPRGADGGKDIGRAQRTPQEVADVVKAVAEARGSESREITAEQLLYSLAGNKLVTEVLYWLQLKDAYSALRF